MDSFKTVCTTIVEDLESLHKYVKTWGGKGFPKIQANIAWAKKAIEETPDLPPYEDVVFALLSVMDGVKEHEVKDLTGLPNTQCAKVFTTYSALLDYEKNRK